MLITLPSGSEESQWGFHSHGRRENEVFVRDIGGPFRGFLSCCARPGPLGRATRGRASGGTRLSAHQRPCGTAEASGRQAVIGTEQKNGVQIGRKRKKRPFLFRPLERQRQTATAGCKAPATNQTVNRARPVGGAAKTKRAS